MNTFTITHEDGTTHTYPDYQVGQPLYVVTDLVTSYPNDATRAANKLGIDSCDVRFPERVTLLYFREWDIEVDGECHHDEHEINRQAQLSNGSIYAVEDIFATESGASTEAIARNDAIIKRHMALIQYYHERIEKFNVVNEYLLYGMGVLTGPE